MMSNIISMSEQKAPQRLGKAAVQLGVSKDTIVEFLSKKGITVENNSMAKIEADAYDLLVAEFATDLAAKEKTATAAKKERESRSTITLEDTKKGKKEDKEEVEPEIDYEKFKRKVEVKPAPEKPKVVAKPEEPVPVEVPEPVAAKPEPKEEIAPPPAPVEEDKPHEMKVVGKIDLDSLESGKTKGRKKSTTAEAQEEEKKKSAKGKKKEEPVEETPAPVAEAAPVVTPEVTAVPEKELIRVKVEKLSGVKLMGKIELPTEPEKEKAGSPETRIRCRQRETQTQTRWQSRHSASTGNRSPSAKFT